MNPGEEATWTENSKWVIKNVDLDPFIYWKEGYFYFDNTPLSAVMKELGRWYNFDVTYNAPDIEDMHFTIDVKKYGDLSKIISLMEKMNKVKFGFKNQSIIVDKK